MIAASVRLLQLFAYVYLVTFLFVLFGTVFEVSGAIPFGPTRLPMLITFVWRGPIIATPLVVGAAWRMRGGGSEPTSTWRARALVAALVLVTTNAARSLAPGRQPRSLVGLLRTEEHVMRDAW